jgi:hypothetical protein
MFIDHVCKGALILSECCHKSTLLRVLMFIDHICKVAFVNDNENSTCNLEV